MFAEYLPHDFRIAVGRPLHLAAAVALIDEQPFLPRPSRLRRSSCGTYEPSMWPAGPVVRPGSEIGVQLSKIMFLFRCQSLTGDDQKVAVAVPVGVAQRKRPLEVGADEVVSKDPRNTRHESTQQFVEVRERCRGAAGVAAHGAQGSAPHATRPSVVIPAPAEQWNR